ncbi:MAG TPA: Holliday junction branch migration protein RuvA [Verrucomicrobiae bacterium]|jgi:holliday junction DNA helicase RuvA|nr:Holliday junction branch migration protein RuvA [Verrucomicrobiae bacterium]
MIGRITGILDAKSPGEITIDVGGVGYQIFIPLSVFYRLPEPGEKVRLFIHTHLREDALQLFGFLELEEKQMFLLLNSVAGIGPKLAVTILSGIPADDLARALREGDQARLLSIPGVGKKLAERMVVELRDKAGTMPVVETGAAATNGASQVSRDAISALVNLGYRRADAEKAIRDITQKQEGTLGEVLKEALRRLSQ